MSSDANPLCVELREYGQSNGDEALRQHIQERIDQMTAAAAAEEELIAEMLLSLKGTSWEMLITDDDDRKDRMACWINRGEACRLDYNAELSTSAGLSTGVFVGCGIATAGAGLAFCGIGALAIHGFGISAAQSRRGSCNIRARQDCNWFG